MIDDNFHMIFETFVPVIRFGSEENESEEEGSKVSDDFQKKIDAAVESATAPLKANRDSILDEKRQLKKQYDEMQKTIEALGGDDGIKALVETRKRLEKDELGRLLADGKYEEWYEQKTTAMRADHKNQLEALENQAKTEKENAQKAIGRLSKMFLRNEVGASSRDLKTLQEEAVIDDICRLAEEFFIFSEQYDRCIIKDANGGIVLGKDGKTPKTTTEWLEEQKKIRRHWWPPSKSGGVEGGMEGAFETDADIENMTQQQYENYRKTKGFRNQFQY